MKPTLPSVVICDIDGTLAIKGDRSPFDWQRVGEDKLNTTINKVLLALGHANDIIFFSGRDGSCADLTRKWLEENGWPYAKLFTRAAGDMRKDSIVKRELYDQHIVGKYSVLCVLDDRDQVVRMWRDELGLTCLQVAYGDF